MSNMIAAVAPGPSRGMVSDAGFDRHGCRHFCRLSGDLAKTGSRFPSAYIELYAPAITATGSGLVHGPDKHPCHLGRVIGRDLILELGGTARTHSEDSP